MRLTSKLRLSFLLFFCLFNFDLSFAAIDDVGVCNGTGGQCAGIAVGSEQVSQAQLFPITINTGEFLVVGGAVWRSAGPPSSVGVTSTCSAALTVLSADDAAAGNNIRFFIAYGFATSTTTCTATVTPAESGYISFGMNAFTGVNTTPLDVDAGYNLNAGVASTTPNQNITTLTNALIVGVMSHTGTTAGITPDGAYTEIYEEDDTDFFTGISMIFRIAPASIYNVNWTLGASRTWMTYVVSFSPATAAPSAVRRRIVRVQ